MKILKCLFLAIVSIAFMATCAIAQSVPVVPADMSMAASKSALRVWAIGQVASGRASVYCSSQVGFSPGQSIVLDKLPTMATIIKAVDDTNSKFVIKITNPKDWVSISDSLNNADGDYLFVGSGGAQPLATPQGDYLLPAVQVTMWLCWSVPIPVGSNIASAEMLVTNQQAYGGYTQVRVPLQVRNGKVQFQSDMAGKGILVLTTNTGEVSAYDLTAGGVKTATPSFVTLSNTSFENIQLLKDPSIIGFMVSSYNGVGSNQVFEVNMTSAGVVLSAVYTSEGALPTGYWVKSPGASNYVFTKRNDPSYYVPIPLGVGTSYIIPEWSFSDFHDPDPYVPNGSDEKG